MVHVCNNTFHAETSSISWLMMPWLLLSPGHQQPWYWPWKVEELLSASKINGRNLCSTHVRVVYKNAITWEKFNINKLSNQYGNSHYEDNTDSLLSYVYNGNTYIWKDVFMIAHLPLVMIIFISKLNSIGSDNGLSPGQRQVIIWTNARILSICTLRTNFSGILMHKRNSYIFINENTFENIVCEMAVILSLPQCVKTLPHCLK